MRINEDRVSREQNMRTSLQDVLTVLDKLAGTCSDLREVIQLIELAVGTEATEANDAQLRILMAILSAPPPKSETTPRSMGRA